MNGRVRSVLPAVLVLAALGCRSGGGGSTAKDVEFGMRSAKAGLWNEAVFRWERALLDHPSDPRLHNNLGIAYEHEGRYEEARKEYQRALDLDPENAYIKKNIEAFENFYKKNKLKGPGQDDSAAGEDAEKHAS